MVPKEPPVAEGLWFFSLSPGKGAGQPMSGKATSLSPYRMFGLLSPSPFLGEPGSPTELPPPLSTYLPAYPPRPPPPLHRVLAGSRQGCNAERVRVWGSAHPSLLCKGLAAVSASAWSPSP